MSLGGRVWDRRGFTLVELLVAMTILLLVLSVANGLFYGSIISLRHGEERTDSRENLRLGLDRMSRELRMAEEIAEDSDPSNLKFTNAEGDAVHYFVNASNELVRIAGNQNLVLASGVAELILVYVSGNQVSITLKSTSGLTLDTMVTLRTTQKGKD